MKRKADKMAALRGFWLAGWMESEIKIIVRYVRRDFAENHFHSVMKRKSFGNGTYFMSTLVIVVVVVDQK